MKRVLDFERCEAAKPDGTRCRYEATEYVRNPGAPMSYGVCGIHKRAGERSLARINELPKLWMDRWKFWLADAA